MRIVNVTLTIALLTVFSVAPTFADDTQQGDLDRQQAFSIEAQALDAALLDFSDQANVQVMVAAATIEGLETNGVEGTYTARSALAALLDSNDLQFTEVGKTVAVTSTSDQGGDSDSKNLSAGPTPVVMAQNTTSQTLTTASRSDDEQIDAQVLRIPEILVIGKSTNVDIARTRDDVQPYVVFDGTSIDTAVDTDLQGFLRTRLPMNFDPASNSQNSGLGPSGNESEIDLRGLGADQTLILVNGRRMPSISRGREFGQPDINGIPLSAIERIEVLPSTASGIYGGGATGGVINVILKKDFDGLELSATYDSPMDINAPTVRFDLSGGSTFNRDRTNFFVTASYSEADDLLVGDRDFMGRGRALEINNAPEGLLDALLPPSGSTANIRSALGTDLVLASDGTSLGSPITSVPTGYEGPQSDGGLGLIENAGIYNLEIPDTLEGNRASLLSAPTVFSASGTLRHEFTDRIDAFLDVGYYMNRGESFQGFTPNFAFLQPTAANNPFTSPIFVRFPATSISARNIFESETTQVAAGVIARLWTNWNLSMDLTTSQATFSGDQSNQFLNLDGILAINAGTLDVLRDTNAFPLDFSSFLLPQPEIVGGPVDTDLNTASVRMAGPSFSTSAGSATTSVLVERREERLGDSFTDVTDVLGGTSTTFQPKRNQVVESAYVETLIPLISSRNEMQAVKTLELQASVRYDRYKTRTLEEDDIITLPSRSSPLPDVPRRSLSESSTDYTLGIKYSPVDDLTLRASFGTGFLPASLSQLVPDPQQGRAFTATDPRRGGQPSFILVDDAIFAGNPDLEPEQSESFSVGLIYEPRFSEGLRVSLDYTRIEKTSEIAAPSLDTLLAFEDQFSDRIGRAPLTPEDEALGFTGGQIVFLDLSLLNFARSEVEAYDMQIDYSWEIDGLGQFQAFAIGTYQTKLEIQETLDGNPIDSVGFLGGPLQLRANFGVNWQRGPLTLIWNAEYYDDYLVYGANEPQSILDARVAAQGSSSIPSQTYHHLFAGFGFDDLGNGGFLEGLDIRLGIRNVFDKRPPTVASIFGFLVPGYSQYGDPRLRSFNLSIRKKF